MSRLECPGGPDRDDNVSLIVPTSECVRREVKNIKCM